MYENTRGQWGCWLQRSRLKRESYWVQLKEGGQLTQNKPRWRDEEGRHGSSKWCRLSAPCQLSAEARREIWHYFVLSTEKIIGLQASSPTHTVAGRDVLKFYSWGRHTKIFLFLKNNEKISIDIIGIQNETLSYTEFVHIPSSHAS